MLRKVSGFVIGFIGTLALIGAILAALDVPPRAAGASGYLIILLSISIGVSTSRVFADPRKAAADASLKLEPVRERWWKLDEALRLCLVVGAIWALGTYLLQIDSWRPNLKLVFVPPLALIGLYFAYRHLVRPQGSDSTRRL